MVLVQDERLDTHLRHPLVQIGRTDTDLLVIYGEIYYSLYLFFYSLLLFYSLCSSI